MKEQIISRNENIFIIEALRSSLRLDGRRPFDTRSLRFEFGEQYGQVEVQLGETRVLVVVTAKVVPPRPERPTEGFFQFFVEVNLFSIFYAFSWIFYSICFLSSFHQWQVWNLNQEQEILTKLNCQG